MTNRKKLFTTALRTLQTEASSSGGVFKTTSTLVSRAKGGHRFLSAAQMAVKQKNKVLPKIRTDAYGAVSVVSEADEAVREHTCLSCFSSRWKAESRAVTWTLTK